MENINKYNLLNLYDNYLDVVKKIESNINLSSELKELLYNFKLNCIRSFYNRLNSIEIYYSDEMEETIYEFLINIFNKIKKDELNKKYNKEQKDSIINELNNKISLLEYRNTSEKRKYELNQEFTSYYEYKLFIQTLYDLLYDDYIGNDDIYYYPSIDVDSFLFSLITLDDNEYFKLFLKRNKIKDLDTIYDCINDTNNVKRKDLLDACYREIQGLLYTDELIKEISEEENIDLSKNMNNPLTLKFKL